MEWPHCSRHILQYTFNSIVYVYLLVSMLANYKIVIIKIQFNLMIINARMSFQILIFWIFHR